MFLVEAGLFGDEACGFCALYAEIVVGRVRTRNAKNMMPAWDESY